MAFYFQKTSHMSSLESKYTDLESAHQTLVRNSELQKNKVSKIINYISF